MQKTKGNTALNIALLCLSLILAVGVATLFRPCAAKEDGTWMNCHYAGRNVMWVGVALCVVSLARFVIKSLRPALDAVQAVLAVVALLIPGTIMHLCMMADMRCNAVMKPSVTVLSVLIIVLSVVDCAVALKARK